MHQFKMGPKGTLNQHIALVSWKACIKCKFHQMHSLYSNEVLVLTEVESFGLTWPISFLF